MLLTAHYDFPIFNSYFVLKTLAFVAIAAFGWQLRSNPRLGVLFPSAICASIFFYLTTNTAAWFFEPGYTKSIGGWVQAVTIGLPGFPQTWQFYLNTLLSDMLFTCLFVASFRFTRRDPKAEAVVLSPARW